MKTRVSVVLLAIMFMVSISGIAFAQRGGLEPQEVFQQKLGSAKVHSFQGTVLSHDVACHCIVVKAAKGNLTLQDDYAKFDGDYDRAKGVQAGAKIKGTYKTVDYINYALEIHMVE